MIASRRIAGSLAVAVFALPALGARPLVAQDFRVGGGITLPSFGDRNGHIGGQGQASIELGPRTSGFGVRMDVLYSQTSAPALALDDLVSGGQTARTFAAAGGLFYRREVRDFAPYVIGGGGAYGQTGMSGVSLGVNAGVGVDYAGSRYRPFFEARMHRWQGDAGSVAVSSRERRLVSAIVGLRF
jgi:hypothetical protein